MFEKETKIPVKLIIIVIVVTLLFNYTLNVVETQIFIQSLTLLITHHGLSLWT